MNVRIYLELLAREAAPIEFEGPVAGARAAGASAEELAELEDAKRAALRVRAVLTRRARREAELAALFDTAGDLAGLRDLDAVLQAIVRRARQLLGTDTSYMTLLDDERGDTYMRVTDGSISRAFQQLRLPPGAGLGGLVAQTSAPYASADYGRDARFRHTSTIDSGVREEGLVAILGVPMRLGTRVIGVLFAADRAERAFGQDEVALLCSLAAHAAVAIDNTRLLDETRAALDELSAANRAARERNAAVERAARAHDRMTDIVVRGGGVEDVAAVVTDVLGGAVLVVDSGGHPLAHIGDLGQAAVTEAAAATPSTRDSPAPEAKQPRARRDATDDVDPQPNPADRRRSVAAARPDRGVVARKPDRSDATDDVAPQASQAETPRPSAGGDGDAPPDLFGARDEPPRRRDDASDTAPPAARADSPRPSGGGDDDAAPAMERLARKENQNDTRWPPDPAAVAARGRVVRRGNLRMAAIAAGAETFGTLYLRSDGDLSEADERIVERAAVVIALLWLFRRSVAEAEARVRGELLHDLVTGRIEDAEALEARARLLGIDPRAAYVLLVACHHGQRERAEFWAAGFARARSGLSLAYREEVVVLIPGDQPGDLARTAASELGEAMGAAATVGAAGPVALPDGAGSASDEARRCARALAALGREGDGASAAELGFVGLLLGDRTETRSFVHSVLGPLLDYDARRGTALIPTLQAYFATGRSPSRAAEELHVHANTVAQRLERVGRLLGADWQRPERELELRLALRLERLSGTTDGPANVLPQHIEMHHRRT